MHLPINSYLDLSTIKLGISTSGRLGVVVDGVAFVEVVVLIAAPKTMVIQQQ